MTFDTHPRQIQRFRDVKPGVNVCSFKCRSCKEVRYSFQGRKKAAGGGWNCAECVAHA